MTGSIDVRSSSQNVIKKSRISSQLNTSLQIKFWKPCHNAWNQQYMYLFWKPCHNARNQQYMYLFYLFYCILTTTFLHKKPKVGQPKYNNLTKPQSGNLTTRYNHSVSWYWIWMIIWITWPITLGMGPWKPGSTNCINCSRLTRERAGEDMKIK